MPVRTVIHRFAETAKFFPERAALYMDGRHYRYRELAALAQGIRNGLIESGFAGAARIGLLTGRDPCSYASILAILANGSAYVPLDDCNPRALNARIIDEAALDVVLVSDVREAAGRLEAALPGEVEVMRTRAADSDPRWSTGLDVSEISGDALAYIMYSQDGPTGVPIYHRNLNSFFDALLDPQSGDYVKEDRFLQMFELGADRSVAAFFAPLCIGACCCVYPDEECAGPGAARWFAEQELTVALMAPPPAGEWPADVELPRLRHSLFFGPVVAPLFIEQWAARAPNARIRTVYGRAEATVYCLSRDWQRGACAGGSASAVTIGTPLPRMEAFVVDAANRPAAPGEAGVLCLYGAQVGGHYWNDPARTAAAFIDVQGTAAKAYRTGDICSIDESGALVFHGHGDAAAALQQQSF